ncbi:MAG: hypothetical protein IH948_06165 [Bacteroidetes bacterium]|nr:hypothetical protein [Bacteroidota bacterium]
MRKFIIIAVIIIIFISWLVYMWREPVQSQKVPVVPIEQFVFSAVSLPEYDATCVQALENYVGKKIDPQQEARQIQDCYAKIFMNGTLEIEDELTLSGFFIPVTKIVKWHIQASHDIRIDKSKVPKIKVKDNKKTLAEVRAEAGL